MLYFPRKLKNKKHMRYKKINKIKLINLLVGLLFAGLFLFTFSTFADAKVGYYWKSYSYSSSDGYSDKWGNGGKWDVRDWAKIIHEIPPVIREVKGVFIPSQSTSINTEKKYRQVNYSFSTPANTEAKYYWKDYSYSSGYSDYYWKDYSYSSGYSEKWGNGGKWDVRDWAEIIHETPPVIREVKGIFFPSQSQF